MSQIESNPSHPQQNFELKKRKFFQNLGIRETQALGMHKWMGLWDVKDGKRDWGNVSEHCLVEMARVDVFSELLGLSSQTRGELRQAAALHDYSKKLEKEVLEIGGLSFKSYDTASHVSNVILERKGFSQNVVKLTGSVGHASLIETEGLVGKTKLGEDDLAYLIMHYVDDYTVNAEWVKPAKKNDKGEWVNDLDRRMDKNDANPRYQVINQEGLNHFKDPNGNQEMSYQAQRRIGHLVENRLAAIISEELDRTIDPFELPEIVDQKIKEKISSF